MADEMGLSTVLRASPVSGVDRDATRPGVMRSRAGNERAMWLIAIHVGCLVLALACAIALALCVSAPVRTSNGVPVDRELDSGADVPTVFEIDGDTVQRFGAAFSR